MEKLYHYIKHTLQKRENNIYEKIINDCKTMTKIFFTSLTHKSILYQCSKIISKYITFINRSSEHMPGDRSATLHTTILADKVYLILLIF